MHVGSHRSGAPSSRCLQERVRSAQATRVVSTGLPRESRHRVEEKGLRANMAITEGEALEALALAGRDPVLRDALLETLRHGERAAPDPASFRERVRRPLLHSLLRDADYHRVTLSNGLMYDVRPESRIEEALLLSLTPSPDHVWEPQTTRLLTQLAEGARSVIIGGAHIGDHALPIARVLERSGGTVHAFEPSSAAYRSLLRNIEINGVGNVVVRNLALWDRSTVLTLGGPAPLSPPAPADSAAADGGERIAAVSIDEYVAESQLSSVGLIMLDTEGGEEMALAGAAATLAGSWSDCPHLVFEVHRHYVDWTPGLHRTSIVSRVLDAGYTVFAVRDLHDNYPMEGKAIEVIPVDRVYLEGPPHGFSLFCTKEPGFVERLGLRVVADVSPKLIPGHPEALFQPVGGF
jgi:FkbM family methyltransferase